MELSDFISKTINEIVVGINKAKEDSAEGNYVINPTFRELDRPSTNVKYVVSENTHRVITPIDFDIAVTATTISETGLGGGAKIPIISVNANNSVTEKGENISRVKFTINIMLPTVDPTNMES